MKKKSNTLKPLVVGILIAIALIILPRVFKDTFIIYLGIQTAKVISVIFMILGIIIVILSLASIYVDYSESKRESDLGDGAKDLIDAYYGDARNYDDAEIDWRTKIINRMKTIMSPIRSLSHAYDEFTGDIDSIKTKRIKIKEIAEENGIELANVKTTLENSETTIFKNIQKALNCATLWNVNEENNPAFADIYNERKNYIQSVIEINDKICVNCDKLLSQAVQYVNAKAEGLSDNSADISSMNKTLSTLQSMNTTVDDFQIKHSQ